MLTLIPRPIRDLVEIPYKLACDDNYYGNDREELTQQLFKAVARTALAAGAVFALCKFGGSFVVAGALGAILTLPTTLIALGAAALVGGSVAIINSLSTGILLELGIGLLAMAIGYAALEYHDFSWVDIGILESFLLKPMSNYIGNPTGE